jgi:hypothetical protein
MEDAVLVDEEGVEEMEDGFEGGDGQGHDFTAVVVSKSRVVFVLLLS